MGLGWGPAPSPPTSRLCSISLTPGRPGAVLAAECWPPGAAAATPHFLIHLGGQAQCPQGLLGKDWASRQMILAPLPPGNPCSPSSPLPGPQPAPTHTVCPPVAGRLGPHATLLQHTCSVSTSSPPDTPFACLASRSQPAYSPSQETSTQGFVLQILTIRQDPQRKPCCDPFPIRILSSLSPLSASLLKELR